MTEQKMGKWVSVLERYPTNTELKRFKVKQEVGSINVTKQESITTGKMTPTGYRFAEGDWVRVTHWYEE